MITLTINGKKVEAKAGETVLEAADRAGIYIPNLCYHPDVKPTGACRMCIVQIEGRRGFPTSCNTEVADGMVVETETDEIKEYRKNLIWLTKTEINNQIDEDSQLRKVVDYVGEKEILEGEKFEHRELPRYTDDPLFERDLNKCILCGRCVQICQHTRKVGGIGFVGRGYDTIVDTGLAGKSLNENACRFCGACVEVCPTGALKDKRMAAAKGTGKTKEELLVPCSNTCPAGIDIPRYVHLIAEGRFQDSLEVIRESVPFPHVLGCVCDHPCESACRRNDINDGIFIRGLKRFVAEQDNEAWVKKTTVEPDTGKSVAIVGGGPAGLSAAWYLRRKGHAVTVFEEAPEAGGMLRLGIPKYRLPREVLDKEIKYITDLGVELKCNTRIESVEELKKDFDAVFLAIGAMKGSSMGLENEDNPKVYDGISLLNKINLGQDVNLNGHLAVVGGGNVAIDVVRSGLRSGADKVTLLYRRTKEEMPADDAEIHDALEEGVEMMFLVNPTRIINQPNGVGVECIRMELGEPDESGRRRPVPVEGSEFVLDVDHLAIAIGQKSDISEGFKVASEWGKIVTDGNGKCKSEIEGVFAGGDVVTGPKSVITAIAEGRDTASTIDKYLGGNGDISQVYVPEEDLDTRLGRLEGFGDLERIDPELIPVEDRYSNFEEVEKTLTEEAAKKEASRCLTCQLRGEISETILPPTEGCSTGGCSGCSCS